jgi:hypothetical protein
MDVEDKKFHLLYLCSNVTEPARIAQGRWTRATDLKATGTSAEQDDCSSAFVVLYKFTDRRIGLLVGEKNAYDKNRASFQVNWFHTTGQLVCFITRCIIVTERAGTMFQKFFLRRTQDGTAFWNLFFPGFDITNTTPVRPNFGPSFAFREPFSKDK